MSDYPRPTLPELRNRIKADFDSGVEKGDTNLRRGLLEVDAIVHAGQMHGVYGAIAAQANKILPIDGDEETVLKWAAMKDLNRLDAQLATGDVDLIGNDGAVIAAQTRYQSNAAQIYIVQADVTVAAGVAVVTVLAEEAGSAANLAAGGKLSLVSPIAGVQSQGLVATNGLQGGADQETITALLERVLFELRNPPRGGSEADYIRWAKAAHPSVTRVFPVAKENGPGTVVVRFTTDNEASIIPVQQIVNAVSVYTLERAPLDLDSLEIKAPVAKQRNFDFTELTPNTAVVQAAIETEINDLYRRAPVPGINVPNSKLTEAVSIAEGEQSHVLNSVAPVLAAGDIEVVGVFTWPAP